MNTYPADNSIIMFTRAHVSMVLARGPCHNVTHGPEPQRATLLSSYTGQRGLKSPGRCHHNPHV